MRVRSTDGVELEVHDLGGAGPDVLLVHATGFHGRVWEPLAGHLPGYRRWSVDMRAHGDSTIPMGRPLEWDSFADDVLAVVDALGLEQPYGVGHSKGGAALLLAEQRRPGTFRSLYCYEPVVMPPELATGANADNPLSRGALRRRDTFASHDEAIENYSAKPPFSSLDRAALRAYVEHGFAPTADGAVTLKCLPRMEADVYAQGSAHQAFRHLGEVRCPVTIALGDEAVPPASFGRPIAAALPRGRVASLPHLGHFGPLEDPPAVAASVLAAFADDPAALS
jgi:pimeloyl-ACP methyl ester carboxylesterase